MYSHFFNIAFLAAFSKVYAQRAGFASITAPSMNQVISTSPFDIVWQPSTDNAGPISLTLLQGVTPATLEIGDTLAAGIPQESGKYSWAISPNLEQFATYGIKLTLDSDPSIFQFSFPFHIDLKSLGAGTGAGSTTTSIPQLEGSTTTVRLGTTSATTSSPSAITSAETPPDSQQSSSPPSSLSSSSQLSTSQSNSSPTQTSNSKTSSSSATTSSSQEPASTSIDLASQKSQSPPKPSETRHSQSNLSTGAKAGIGIGAALGLLIILSLVAFAFWFGKRSAKNKNSAAGDEAPTDKTELPAGTVRATELDNKSGGLTEKGDYGGAITAAELDAKSAERVEVEGKHYVEMD